MQIISTYDQINKSITIGHVWETAPNKAKMSRENIIQELKFLKTIEGRV